MKLFYFLLSVFIFLHPTPIFAHGQGMPPFFKINGVYSDFYPIISNAYLPDFDLPQDIAHQPFPVSESISFDIDTTKLPFDQETIRRSKFFWDFGDGEKAEGLKQKYAYKKIGSYIQKIYVNLGDQEISNEPQLIQSTMIHILPDASYQLPKLTVTVNDQKVGASPNDVVEVDFNKLVKLEASSLEGTSKIVSFYWDLDDGNSSKDKSVNHKYSAPRYFATPIVRAIDENGFIVDTSFGLRDKEVVTTETSQNMYTILGGILLIVILIGVFTLLFLRKKNK